MTGRIIWTVLFFGVLIVLPVRSAESPSQSETQSLGSPTKHWAYELPPTRQSNPVSIVIRAVNTDNKPLTWPCEILADCHPWGFRRHVALDANGQYELCGPIGDWSFETCVRSPEGPILFNTRRGNITGDTTVIVKVPARFSRMTFQNTGGDDLLNQLLSRRYGPGDEKVFPCIYYVPLSSSGLPPSLTGGNLIPNTVARSLHVQAAEDLIVGLVAGPRPGNDGYAVFARRRPGGAPILPVDSSALAMVSVEVGTDWPDMNLEMIGLNQEEIPVYLYVPLMRPGVHTVRIRPGVSRIGLRTKDGAFVPVVHELAPGGRIEARYRGPFAASPEVLRWDRGYMSVWFDIADQVGNNLLSFIGKGHLILRRDGAVIYNQEVTRSSGRVAEIIRDWGQGWDQQLVEYEYTLDSAITGRITQRGSLDPKRTIDQTMRIVSQTPRFEFLARQTTPNAARVTAAAERFLDALSSSIAGPVQPSHGGRFRLQCTSPCGLSWSSGNTVALDIYAAQWFWPIPAGEAVGVMFHEFGHSYSLVPPRNQPLWGEDEGQGFATWLAYQGLRSVYGQRAFQAFRMEQNINLLSAAADQPVSGFMFVMDYIDQRFGPAVNLQAYRILYTGQGDLRKRIEQDTTLKTEHQRLAVLHSVLTGQNLAWLYRWGRYSVTDDTVAVAMTKLER
jgi:hypothetical protein